MNPAAILLKKTDFLFRQPGPPQIAWEFAKDGQDVRIRVDGQLTFNNSYAMIDAAVNGYGIAYLPENLVDRQIKSGKLVLVLSEWSPSFDGYYIYYPSKRQNSPAFKAIVDALRHRRDLSKPV